MNTENTTPDPTNVPASDPATTTQGTEPGTPSAAVPAEGQGGVATPEGTADDKGEAPKPDEQAPTGAPEAYDAFTVPEGFALEGERLEQANSFFKELNLDQAKAQKAVDLFCQLSVQDSEAITKAMDTLRADRIEQWGADSKKQLGDQYDATVEDARLLLTAHGTPELKEAFNTEGWGNHPELLKILAAAGRALKDSSMPGTGGLTATTVPKSAAEVLYDHPTSQAKR